MKALAHAIAIILAIIILRLIEDWYGFNYSALLVLLFIAIPFIILMSPLRNKVL